MATGNNKSKLSKKATPILSSGRFSGRSLGVKRGPGVPTATTHRKATWYEGEPYVWKSVGQGFVGQIHQVRTTRKNPNGRP